MPSTDYSPSPASQLSAEDANSLPLCFSSPHTQHYTFESHTRTLRSFAIVMLPSTKVIASSAWFATRARGGDWLAWFRCGGGRCAGVIFVRGLEEGF